MTPSTFNVFRDSLRETSEELRQQLVTNLPEMNLNEIDDSGEESDASSVDIVPLDFRTALIND